MLAGLGHRALLGGDHQDRPVHLRSAGEHVPHVLGVAGTVDVRVVAARGLILQMRALDGESAAALERRAVDVLVRHELGPALPDRTRVMAAVSVVFP